MVGNVPINRTRALVICHAPQAYAPSRVREAASYLLQSSASTEEEPLSPRSAGARGVAPTMSANRLGKTGQGPTQA